MNAMRECVRIDGGGTSLVLALAKGASADVVYLGPTLPQREELSDLASAASRARHESQPDIPPVPGLLPECKGGWSGTPAIELSQLGHRIATDLRVHAFDTHTDRIAIEFVDERALISAHLTWEIDPGGVIECNIAMVNASAEALTLDRLASVALPVPARFNEMTTYGGRWAGEMRETRRAIAPDGLARRSSIGKPGFDGGNWLLLHAHHSDEVLAAHLEWSGDFDTRLECDGVGAGDGRAHLQMGASWEQGEITLAPGARFESPSAIIARAENRSALAGCFHTRIRRALAPLSHERAARKVHLNSWEALGFSLSQETLFALVDSAAELGVERFVLDDGWFGARRNDRTSLGDWFASHDVFPDGLAPLIARVRERGMDFGLWVEPEMVSPDSELYRAHPDWCLHLADNERPEMRGQLVLDLTNPHARSHVLERLRALLGEHDIAYLKWDHNRDLFPRAGRGFRQTEAFYSLLKALRERWPKLEIESCSSGGGRIDTAVLKRTNRVWPSDNNDPIERSRIMRAWAQFLPLEVLGNHVGPSPNPITGRQTQMDFRAKVALFGHMGVEADPGSMSADERHTLAAHIALYKEWRGALHAGKLWRLEHSDPGVGGLIVTHQERALALVTQTGFSASFDAAPILLAGLDPVARYRVTLAEPWPKKASQYLFAPDRWRDGLILTGRALLTQGIALPLTHPETAWVIALEKVS